MSGSNTRYLYYFPLVNQEDNTVRYNCSSFYGFIGKECTEDSPQTRYRRGMGTVLAIWSFGILMTSLYLLYKIVRGKIAGKMVREQRTGNSCWSFIRPSFLSSVVMLNCVVSTCVFPALILRLIPAYVSWPTIKLIRKELSDASFLFKAQVTDVFNSPSWILFIAAFCFHTSLIHMMLLWWQGLFKAFSLFTTKGKSSRSFFLLYGSMLLNLLLCIGSLVGVLFQGYSISILLLACVLLNLSTQLIFTRCRLSPIKDILLQPISDAAASARRRYSATTTQMSKSALENSTTVTHKKKRRSSVPFALLAAIFESKRKGRESQRYRSNFRRERSLVLPILIYCVALTSFFLTEIVILVVLITLELLEFDATPPGNVNYHALTKDIFLIIALCIFSVHLWFVKNLIRARTVSSSKVNKRREKSSVTSTVDRITPRTETYERTHGDDRKVKVFGTHNLNLPNVDEVALVEKKKSTHNSSSKKTLSGEKFSPLEVPMNLTSATSREKTKMCTMPKGGWHTNRATSFKAKEPRSSMASDWTNSTMEDY